MLNKAKLPGDLWARMVWEPRTIEGPDDRPIVLISDRRRLLVAGIPMLAAFLLAGVLILLHASPLLSLALLLTVVAIARFGRSTKDGYYEVRADGTLGEYLGSRMPPAIRDMRRVPL